jgi:hypothetical protein
MAVLRGFASTMVNFENFCLWNLWASDTCDGRPLVAVVARAGKFGLRRVAFHACTGGDLVPVSEHLSVVLSLAHEQDIGDIWGHSVLTGLVPSWGFGEGGLGTPQLGLSHPWSPRSLPLGTGPVCGAQRRGAGRGLQ